MTNKIGFKIKKYTKEEREKELIFDLKNIKSEKIIFKKNNLSDCSFEDFNSREIEKGREKFKEIYGKKSPINSVENFIITFSVLNEKFFNTIKLDKFIKDLYFIISSKISVVSYYVTYDVLKETTFYFVCSSVVNTVFLDHIKTHVEASGRDANDLSGVLSYNLILGGNRTENPLGKFINLVLSELNALGEYNLEPATENEVNNYILKSYHRASARILELEQELRSKEIELMVSNLQLSADIEGLFKILISSNSKFKPVLLKVIKDNHLDSLKDFIK